MNVQGAKYSGEKIKVTEGSKGGQKSQNHCFTSFGQQE